MLFTSRLPFPGAETQEGVFLESEQSCLAGKVLLFHSCALSQFICVEQSPPMHLRLGILIGLDASDTISFILYYNRGG